ncbi:MAG: TonB-dependent receptor [Brevundimonas sp.]|uniref:TonB-dependent receptor plug domain-containing protein n=1 Tax=Brevundimonas sp. TaxID=1871086 RepID=UPI0027156C4B|nr:TonB-dependent receptor [Brevundimonas sp.]MDO9588134.1 TonB-dependent receptor [Brevundimonas sp.]MDP3657139.1 TonB-dependent receptor [Brevundimonas sp.]MDZ4112638.1 TonB-dependent receptor [Brevundimonas sp.]
MAFDRKTLLASTIIAGLAVFAPTMVMAQSQPAQGQQEEEEKQAVREIGEVVVTGSRIRRNEFTSSQPIQVITSEQATLEGLADTSEILQSSTAANTATQINNFFTGFVTTGGPGVNTVSLRGLGAQRTLVLINGRRVGPAGVRGTVGPTDLNTIPSSLIERAEILTDGASSIYGSDAVAGVINIITKTNLDGGFIGAYASVPLEGGGEEVQVSASFGETYDRGYISAGLDYYERSELLFGQRDHFDCPQDRVYSDRGLKIRRDVLENGTYKCDFVLNSIMRTQLAGSAGPVLAANRRDGDFVFNSGAVQGGGFTGCDAPGFRHVAGGAGVCSITAQPTAVRRAAYEVYPLYNSRYASRTAISPVTRTSFTAFGGYDLTPNVELFGEFLLNRRESEQYSWRQLFPTVSPYHTNNPFGGPFNGMGNTFNGGYYVTPVALVDTFSRQQVDYARAVVGLRGDIDLFGRGWDWELSAQYSESDGTYGGNFFYNDRVAATAGLDALFAGRPFGASAAPGTPESGNCDVARLTSATACPTGGVNWFTNAFISNGQLSPAEAAFINGYEEGNTSYIHQYVEGVISGELFDLPAGPVGMALGFHMRREEIDDQPGPVQQAGNLWGQTAAGRTRGSDTVKELFAEIELPLLRDIPLFESLSVNLSGRMSDYESYGENSTYKVGLNWRLTPEFRLRASKGTSFRAPALYELFLANQTSFLGQANVDPCRNWGVSTNARLQANCAADGVPNNYNDPGSSALIITGGGVGILQPETADAVSVGLIWTPTFADLNIALDYFQIDVDNQVAQFGAANIVSACYNSDTYPTDPLCSLFVRDKTGGPRNNQILQVNDSYVNISRQSNKGLDLNVRYTREFSFMDLTIAARVSHILDWTQQVFTASVPTILNSRIGSPETVGELSFRFDRGDWTVFYGIDYVGPANNQPFNTNPAQAGGATVFLGENVFVERGVDEYLNHTMSVRKRFDKWTFQAGIQNIFDENPPYLGIGSGSTVIGNTPLASQYDWNGRTAFVNVSRTF